MASPLVFISGASSGIGQALADTVPFPAARSIDISRRGNPNCEHFAADLSKPAEWPRVAEHFRKEIEGFTGDRVVFIHNAGTLDPMGFAGEVDPTGYAEQVLLNSAAPQVLGDAFLRAAAHTEAPCTLLFIGSGAANSVYLGWSAYGAGKAAADHWVRTAGAECEQRGGRCRIVSVAPGVVETDMQRDIRAMTEEAFPDVERFRELHREGALRSPEEAARDLWKLVVEDRFDNGATLDLRDG
ncbi:MAG: SDR family NAD(P)-dependent oxidoreductase [Myxococcota bacterium]